jgi:hypothetical protein
MVGLSVITFHTVFYLTVPVLVMPQRPIAHDDSESESDYNDVSDLDAPVVGISSTTTQSSVSVQGGDMEVTFMPCFTHIW